jgi:osmotically inducible lipoprotein OsmB
MRYLAIVPVLGLLVLAACGETVEQRAATGGVAGAVAGAAVGAPIAGAALGGTAGAATR